MKREIVINMEDVDGTTPIARLVQLANSYESQIYIINDNMKVNAKSIMGMMNLVLDAGSVVTVDVQGDDEEKALVEIEKFLKNSYL